jgi:formate/nitrite transporter FocA (FNT family)
MTREAIEESNRINKPQEDFSWQNFFIDLLGGICGIAFFVYCMYWLVS